MRTLLAILLCLVSALPAWARSDNRDPDAARIVTEDIARFWRAWELAQDADSREARVAIFEREYLSAASAGLRAFDELRIGGAAKLVETLDAHPRYYAQLRDRSLAVERHLPTIRSALRRMAVLYPDALFPDVYFVIGRMNSGGTLSDTGLLIGVEMFGREADTPVDELGGWHRAVLKGMSGLPHIVAHELVHYQQRYPGDGQPTLLQASVAEGVADLIAELASGAHINQHVHAWADPRFDELWAEFRQVMRGTDYRGWLYGGELRDGRPADLGYWMGYRISRAWYERASDKTAALRRLLTSGDFETLVADSGLLDKPGTK